MNFGDKLYNLRREKGLSQEELGEKLNVTRQTVSKWELNQSKPDTDKMKEICSLFSVSMEDLTNDEVKIQKKATETSDDVKPRRWLLIVLIIIAIIISIVLINKVVTDRKENRNGIFDIFNDSTERFSKSSFNSNFEMYAGTEFGSSVSNLLDEVITNNKKNKDRQITVVYGDTETSDSEEIKNLKKNYDNFDKLEVSLDYDDNGYVNKVTIEPYENEDSSSKNNEFEKTSFNNRVTSYSGSKNGFFVKSMIDFVIDTNVSETEHKLFVNYNGNSTSDVNALRDLKSNFENFTDYIVTVSYGEDGFATGFNVE